MSFPEFGSCMALRGSYLILALAFLSVGLVILDQAESNQNTNDVEEDIKKTDSKDTERQKPQRYRPGQYIILEKGSCTKYLLYSNNTLVKKESERLLGTYTHEKSKIYHFKSEYIGTTGSSLLKDDNQWAIYTDLHYTPPPSIGNRVILTGCEKEFLEDCNTLRFSSDFYSWKEDETMELLCLERRQYQKRVKVQLFKKICGEYKQQNNKSVADNNDYEFINPNSNTMYEDLKQQIIDSFKEDGLSEDKFNVWWNDEEGDRFRIKNTDGLKDACEKMTGLLFVDLEVQEECGCSQPALSPDPIPGLLGLLCVLVGSCFVVMVLRLYMLYTNRENPV